MNMMVVINAFSLPPESRVNQRIPKKLLVENGAPTSVDKRQINEGIDELLWVAVLKPTTINVPDYRDSTREYLEIAVLSLILRPEAKAERLVELIHRAIPYPVVLLTQQSETVALSLAHKRWSQSEAGKMVLDGKIITADFCDIIEEGLIKSFLDTIPLTNQPRNSIYALYQGWIEAVIALQIASITGVFTTSTSPSHGQVRHDALLEYMVLESKIANLYTVAKKEKQLHRQVELNLELKLLKATLATVRAKL